MIPCFPSTTYPNHYALATGLYPAHQIVQNIFYDRVQIVANWLKLPAEKRPHLITFYLPQVDDEGHTYGPNSQEVANSVRFIDSAVYALTQAVNATGLKVNFIFVSDHGMSEPDTQHPLPTPAALDTSKFIISGDRMVVELIAKDPRDIQPTYAALKKEAGDYDVYLRENVPAHLHCAGSDDRHNRIGDIVMLPHWP